MAGLTEYDCQWFTQEWITPQPSRRPDIFPEFDKQSTPMPKPMPGDPELPDEEVIGRMAAQYYVCLASSNGRV